jgi:hypothetical protein
MIRGNGDISDIPVVNKNHGKTAHKQLKPSTFLAPFFQTNLFLKSVPDGDFPLLIVKNNMKILCIFYEQNWRSNRPN